MERCELLEYSFHELESVPREPERVLRARMSFARIIIARELLEPRGGVVDADVRAALLAGLELLVGGGAGDHGRARRLSHVPTTPDKINLPLPPHLLMSRLLETRLFNVGGNILDHLKLPNIEEPRSQQPTPRGKLIVIRLVGLGPKACAAVGGASKSSDKPVRGPVLGPRTGERPGLVTWNFGRLLWVQLPGALQINHGFLFGGG